MASPFANGTWATATVVPDDADAMEATIGTRQRQGMAALMPPMLFSDRAKLREQRIVAESRAQWPGDVHPWVAGDSAGELLPRRFGPQIADVCGHLEQRAIALPAHVGVAADAADQRIERAQEAEPRAQQSRKR